MIPLSVFPFPSAPCHKRVVSYPIIAFRCRSFNLSIAALPWGRFSFVQPLSLLRRQGRVAAPSVCFAVACILLAAAPTAPPCFRRWRRSSPLPLVGEPLAKRLTFPICQSLPSIGEVASRSDDGEVWFTMASRTKSEKRQIPKIPSKPIETFFGRRVMDFPPSTAQIGYNSRRRGTGIGRARRGGGTREKEAADLPSAPSRTSLCPAGGTFWRKRSAEHRYDPTRIY